MMMSLMTSHERDHIDSLHITVHNAPSMVSGAVHTPDSWHTTVDLLCGSKQYFYPVIVKTFVSVW